MEEYKGKEDRKIRYWTEAMRCVLNSGLSLYFSCNLLYSLFPIKEPKSLMSAGGLNLFPSNELTEDLIMETLKHNFHFSKI